MGTMAHALMNKVSLAIAAALAASACSGAPLMAPRSGHTVTVRGEVRVQTQAGYGLASTDWSSRVPYELRRLDHIEVWIDNLEDGVGGSILAGTMFSDGHSDADHTFAPVVLSHLKPYTHYRVQLKAFQFDPAAGAIIPVDDNTEGHSETSFDTFDGESGLTDSANEDVSLTNGFKLTLRDQPFNGSAAGTIGITDGHLVAPTDAEILAPSPARYNTVTLSALRSAWKFDFADPQPSNWYQPTFDDTAWASGLAAFGNGNCGGLDPVQTDWPGGTAMYVRRTFNAPAISPVAVRALVAIDNDIIVYLNGTEIGTFLHEGCGVVGEPTITIAPALIVPGTANVLAAKCVDRGGLTAFDLRLEADY